MAIQSSYGPGGVLEWRLIDNGDGTGTLTTYALDGSVESTEEVTDLPVHDEMLTVEPVVALAHALLDAQSLDDVRAVAAQILSDAGVTT